MLLQLTYHSLSPVFISLLPVPHESISDPTGGFPGRRWLGIGCTIGDSSNSLLMLINFHIFTSSEIGEWMAASIVTSWLISFVIKEDCLISCWLVHYIERELMLCPEAGCCYEWTGWMIKPRFVHSNELFYGVHFALAGNGFTNLARGTGMLTVGARYGWEDVRTVGTE